MCLHNVYKKMLLHPCPCYGFVLAVCVFVSPVYPERFKDVYTLYLQENWIA